MKHLLLSSLFLCILLCSSFFVVKAPISHAQTTEQAQIQALLTLITQLQQQLTALLNQQTSCVTLTQTLYIGLNDAYTGGQVSTLQKFLKSQGDYTYPTITGFFGAATQAAVQKFQARTGVVSGGTPASTGYGVAGSATRAKIQALSCGGPTTPPVLPPTAPLPPGMTASCSPSTTSIIQGSAVTWTATASGGTPPYTYVWSGTNNLSGSNSSVTKTYNSDGTKNASVKIDGSVVQCGPSLTVIEDPNLIPPEEEEVVVTEYECSDGEDNDNDDLVDYPYEIGCSSGTDDNEENDELLLTTQGWGSSVWQVNDAENLEAEKMYIIYGLDLNQNGIIDPSEFDTFEDKVDGTIGSGIPSNAKGFAIIDEEGSALFPNLKNFPVGHPSFTQAQQQLIEGINYAKELRPNLRWGYYAYPNFPYWISDNGVTKSWKNASQAAKDIALASIFKATDLLDTVDFFATSLYPNYVGDNENGSDTMRLKDTVKYSLIEGEGKKPVIPFFTHRYFNGSNPLSFTLVPWAEFQNEFGTILDAGAHGVIWWGADTYFYQFAYINNQSGYTPGQLAEANQIKNSFGPELVAANVTNNNYQQYFDLLHIQYLKLAAELYGNIDYEPAPIVLDPPQGGGGAISQSINIFSSLANVFSAIFSWFSM